MAWTTDDLIASVRRRGQLPDAAADGAMTDTDILELANEELAIRLVPLVRSAREDYFVSYEDQSITSGTAKYRVPEGAQGSGLRDVTIVDSDGNESSIPRISLEEAGEAEQYGTRTVFVMEGPFIRLIPAPTVTTGTLRLRFHRSHSQLIPLSGAIAMTLTAPGIAAYPDTGTLRYSTTNTGTVAPFEGAPVDIIRAYPPFVHDYNFVTIASITPDGGGNDVVTFTGVDSFEETGKAAYMVWYGVSPFIRLPRECWPLLVSAVTARVLEVLGDRDAAQLAFALYEREAGNVVELLTPRVEGARKRIIDRHSPLRARRRW